MIAGNTKRLPYRVLASTEGLPREKWLEYRKLGIGGSDASVVCGINRYKSPVELFMEKTGMFPHTEAGEAAYWGNRLEPLVREEFTHRTGIEVAPVKQILQSAEHPFMLANLDGVCQHPIFGASVFEAKTAGAYMAGDWEDGIVPDSYMLQLQHYLSVTGYKCAYIAVLIGGNQFKWRLVERDGEIISMLIRLEQNFWEHVMSNTPPPLDGSEAAGNYLKARFPNSIPQSEIKLPAEAADIIRHYNAAREQADNFNEQRRLAENLLKEMLGENETGIVGDWIVTWKTVMQERLDCKAFKAEHPKLYKKYASVMPHRRFVVK